MAYGVDVNGLLITMEETDMAHSLTCIKTIVGFGFGLSMLHVLWVLLVASGFAQPIIDYIFKIHMLSSPFVVQPFSFSFSAQLLAITFGVGCLYGIVFHITKRLFFDRPKAT